MEHKKIKLLRVSTIPHSLHLLLRGQIRYMKDNGMEVYMASTTGPEVNTLMKNEGAPHYHVPLSRSLNPLQDLKALYHMVKLIRKIKPDIVHSHSPKAGTIGMLAAYICRVPLKMHTVAGLPLMESQGMKRKLLVTVEKLTYRFADWILPNSMELEKYIIENKLAHNSNKLKVLGKGSSNGIDLSYYSKTPAVMQSAQAFKEKYNIADEEVVLCFVGRLAFYKGINELVAAFEILTQKYNKLRLVLVGPAEDINPLNKETIALMNDLPGIISTGHQDDIRPYLAAADIFVFPSYREGFPQSLMQACAMGLPCITTDINGCNEMVFNGVNGSLIPAKHVAAIVDACEVLIADKTKRLQLGKNSRAYIEDNFEQQQFWHKVNSFYIKHLNTQS
ncbi:glycosyltransferase involved in cell wall biosynthesis [Chitinophaga niastensis]|uniref:Glycosyltransferase involved in cell wall biosynthesis n=1 Tax=Chitinophaga niastensis TaxID=536980 RepID=A0A2P8HFD2_CHINA|nr:glycosyltransferase family 4 protein [Chitinophaga niastensis]PSL44904.1 glycosyltransferase involved in cell wall biosynthesis [Chitinophaga niastensis]